ncbi:MAG: hypothetical protein ACODAJ_03690 [Planctomycetota bacterium]
MSLRCCAMILAALSLAGATAALAAEYEPGDWAVVKTDKAEVKQGGKVVDHLTRGTRTKVHWVQGGWVQTRRKLGGKKVIVYVRLSDLEPPPDDGKAPKSPGYRPLDKIIVKAKRAKLMRGKTVLGRVPRGATLTVRKVQGDWLGVKPTIRGKTIFGWLHARDVDYAPFDDEDDEGGKPEDGEPDKDDDAEKDRDEKDEKKDDGDDDWMK